MPNTPNASFIPKQGPVRQIKRTATRQIHVFTVVSYVAFVATLISSLGVFLYNRHLDNQLQSEVEKLSGAIGGFSDSDMLRVREFNVRLRQAHARINQSVSLVSIFEALEVATAKSVVLTDLIIKREEDSNFKLTAKVSSNSFDSSLFQRGLYERNTIIKDVSVSDLTIAKATPDDPISGVSFVAKIIVPLQTIPYTVDTNGPTASQDSGSEISLDAASTSQRKATSSEPIKKQTP